MAGAISATRALRRLNQYKQGRTVQPGMFSTLDEAIQEAPFDVNSADQWAKYLTPGRMVKREGAQFPLKKEELESSGLAERLSSGIFEDQPVTKEILRDHLRSSRPEFTLDVGKEVYDEHGLNPSVQIGEGPIPNAWRESGKLGEIDQMSGEHLDLGRITAMDPKFGKYYGGEGQYHHTSPNSTYEESFTKLKGLVAPTHHTDDTLSWSRTTSHNTFHAVPDKYGNMITPAGNRRVRLVEEIQADVHRKAASKLWYDPTGKQYYINPESAKRGSLDPEAVTEAGRIGYRTENTALEIAGLRETADKLDVKLRNSDPITAGGNVSKKYVKMQDEFKDVSAELERLEMKMADAPHKSPQEYAQLELRKQLMNAVDEGEDYLALARGRDQIERYGGLEGELDPRQQSGLERMYDKVYPGELRKLAKRYGATVEDIELDVNKRVDPDELILPEPMASMGIEDVGELTEATYRELGNSLQAIPGSKTDAQELLDVMYESMRDVNWVEGADQKGAARIAERIKTMKAEVDRLWDSVYAGGGNKDSIAEWNMHVDGKWSELENDFKDVIHTWQEASNVGQEVGMVTKSFPAIKLTPEVKERILDLGVPQFQHGGLVRPDPYPGTEWIPRMEDLEEASEPDLDRLRHMNYVLSGGAPKRELLESMEEAQLYEDPQYWKDVPKHVLASMASLWKTLDPETGEAEWNFGAEPPPFEMVERGLMPLSEWKEMKEVADRVREEKPSRPGIIDETISMRVLMTEIANIFREDREEPPEYAAEAMERTERLQKAVQEGMDLDPAVGFPQRFAQMFGFMLGQVPSPKSATEAVGSALVKAMPKVMAKIPKAAKVAVGAPLEFMDPTIRPSMKTYLTGAGAGTGIIYGIEGAAERRLKELEEQLEEDAEQE